MFSTPHGSSVLRSGRYRLTSRDAAPRQRAERLAEELVQRAGHHHRVGAPAEVVPVGDVTRLAERHRTPGSSASISRR